MFIITVLLAAPVGTYLARTRQVRSHRITFVSVYVGLFFGDGEERSAMPRVPSPAEPTRILSAAPKSDSIQFPQPNGATMANVSGSCLCGAIEYTSPASPVMVAVCHCTHCQKQSGGAFSVNVALPKGSLQFTKGKTTIYQDEGSSGMPVYRHFCAACGSPIFSDVVATPQLDWLKAGTLEDTSWVKPVANIWCDSAQSWVSYPEGVPRFAQNPPAA